MAARGGKDLALGGGSEDGKQDGLTKTVALWVSLISCDDRLAGVTRRITGNGAPLLTKVLEIAAEEFGIESDDQIKSTYRRKTPREYSIMHAVERAIKTGKRGCQHSCSGHKELMNPELWGTLPPELLPLVFAHLPVEDISRLQLLNKQWQQTMSSDAEFYRTCSQVYPRMLCLITSNYCNCFWVRVLDVSCGKWHTYKIVASRPDVHFGGRPLAHMIPECEDGGLVCFISTSYRSFYKADIKKKKLRSGLFFRVVNPLTRNSRAVPPLFDQQERKLVQMQVDRRSKEFRLFVAAEKLVWTNVRTGWTVAGITAQVYDSVTGEWTTVDECLSPNDVDLNRHYGWKVAYDFANGRLFTTDDGTLSTRKGVASAVYKDRLFVLKLGADGPANDELANQSPTYFIEEFHWETVWVKAKAHRCEPFEHPPKTAYSMNLRACSGFLMVNAELSTHSTYHVNKRFGNQLAWLYDLSRMKWSTLALPELPIGRRTDEGDVTYCVNLMFEPRWDI